MYSDLYCILLHLSAKQNEKKYTHTQVCLRLTIVVRTNVEDVELMKLEDESKNMLSSGFLLINPQDCCENNVGEHKGRSFVVAIPLRSSKDIETRLSLKVFCAVKVESKSNITKLARVYSKQIMVPKFAMFAFSKASDTSSCQKSNLERLDLAKSSIKLEFYLKDDSKVTQVSIKFN